MKRTQTTIFFLFIFSHEKQQKPPFICTLSLQISFYNYQSQQAKYSHHTNGSCTKYNFFQSVNSTILQTIPSYKKSHQLKKHSNLHLTHISLFTKFNRQSTKFQPCQNIGTEPF